MLFKIWTKNTLSISISAATLSLAYVGTFFFKYELGLVWLGVVFAFHTPVPFSFLFCLFRKKSYFFYRKRLILFLKIYIIFEYCLDILIRVL